MAIMCGKVIMQNGDSATALERVAFGCFTLSPCYRPTGGAVRGRCSKAEAFLCERKLFSAVRQSRAHLTHRPDEIQRRCNL